MWPEGVGVAVASPGTPPVLCWAGGHSYGAGLVPARARRSGGALSSSELGALQCIKNPYRSTRRATVWVF